MKRDPAIELWRCICMALVVISHVCANNSLPGFSYVQWHVIGFLWISGYFGVRLKFGKIVSLIFTTMVCYWLTIPFRDDFSAVALLFPHGGWFLPFYLVLMLLAPVFEAAVKDEKSHGLMLATIGILLLWGWVGGGGALLSGNNHVKMLQVPGMQGNGLLIIIVVYLFARILGLMKWRINTGTRVLLLVVVLGLSVFLGMTGKCGGLGSPIVILAAACGFYAVKGLPLPGMLSKIVTFMGPSMWSVYVLHECCVKSWQTPGFVNSVGIAVAWGGCLFGACLTIDLVRRGFVMVAKKTWNAYV